MKIIDDRKHKPKITFDDIKIGDTFEPMARMHHRYGRLRVCFKIDDKSAFSFGTNKIENIEDGVYIIKLKTTLIINEKNKY